MLANPLDKITLSPQLGSFSREQLFGTDKEHSAESQSRPLPRNRFVKNSSQLSLKSKKSREVEKKSDLTAVNKLEENIASQGVLATSEKEQPKNSRHKSQPVAKQPRLKQFTSLPAKLNNHQGEA